MYKVIKHFTDLQDNNRPYDVGETYPRKGLNVAPERFAELAGNTNKQGVPLIEEVTEEAKTAPKTPKKAAKTAE
jgi:hypothetical protein